VDGQPVCATTADQAGQFQCTPGASLAVGLHLAQAVAADAAGNASNASNVNGFAITPGAPVISSPASGSLTNNARPAFNGTAPPSAEVEVREGGNVLCSAVADTSGTWSCVPTAALAEGSHEVTATAMIHGEGSPPTSASTFRVDTVPPPVDITAGPESTTTATGGTIVFASSESEATFECSLDGVDFAPCSSPTEYAGLAPGGHVLTVRATDAAGNASTTQFRWDVTIPVELGTFVGGGCGCDASGGGMFALGSFLGLLFWRRRRPATT
jgi:MYXO-CTERM domain-containing protein